MGVKDIFIDDLREEFVRDYVFPMFRANALYEGVYLLGTSIARCAAACGGAGRGVLCAGLVALGGTGTWWGSSQLAVLVGRA